MPDRMPEGAPSISLGNRVAIVTGASRGIGASIARTLAQAGARVVLVSRKREGLESVRAVINEQGGQADVLPCHMGAPDAIEAMVQEAIGTAGPIDILVNNAATNPYYGPLLETEWPAWDKTFDVNVKGYFAASRAVAQHLLERKAPGSIINITSILGTMAGPHQGVYAMTKAAVISLTQNLALELGPSGIRVNAIAPGFIETKFSSTLVDNPSIKSALETRIPVGRIGQPEEIAGLALYLASDAASYATGHTYFVDGGLRIA